MKATLEFNLPEDDLEYELCINGHKYNAIIGDMNNWLRNKLKYGHDFKGATEALEATREALYEMLNNHEVTI